MQRHRPLRPLPRPLLWTAPHPDAFVASSTDGVMRIHSLGAILCGLQLRQRFLTRSCRRRSQLCNDTYAHALLLGSQNEDGVRYNLTFRVMQPAEA